MECCGFRLLGISFLKQIRKRRRKQLKNGKETIRWKLMKYFLMVVMIMGICLFAFYRISMDNVTGVAVTSMENILEKINLDTYNFLHEAQRIAYLEAKDSEIQAALRNDLPSDEQEKYRQRMDFNS
ncbi:MAG: hypothetical protein PHE06_13550, partial [Lachnospiraceae bacterium]|nr:hypothetical protein [Lachnospiraceae bacterium]